jgi:hypothetical protein
MEELIQAELADDLSRVVVTSCSNHPSHKRWSISWLFLWICGTAIVFAAEYSTVNLMTPVGVLPFPAIDRKVQIYAIVSRLLTSPLFGIAFAFGAHSLYRLARHGGTFGQPGHWILYQFFVWICARLAAIVLGPFLEANTGGFSAEVMQGTNVFILLINGTISLAACLLFSEPKWRIYFGIETASSGLIFIYSVGKLLPERLANIAETASQGFGILLVILGTAILSAAAAFSLLVAAAMGMRDRMHFIGIGLWFFYGILVVVDSLALAMLSALGG